MMAKGLFSAETLTGTFTRTREIMMAKGRLSAGISTGTQNIMMATGFFSAGTCGPEPGNHDGKGSLKCRNLYRNPRNHDGTGSLAGTFAETRKSRWQSASYHRNLYRNPRNHDGKGSLSAGTCGPEPANHGQSWWQRVSEAPEPFTGTRKS